MYGSIWNEVSNGESVIFVMENPIIIKNMR